MTVPRYPGQAGLRAGEPPAVGGPIGIELTGDLTERRSRDRPDPVPALAGAARSRRAV
jgi:hypothetical protein